MKATGPFVPKTGAVIAEHDEELQPATVVGTLDGRPVITRPNRRYGWHEAWGTTTDGRYVLDYIPAERQRHILWGVKP